MCGEYGEDLQQPSKLGRPHFHACLFGLDFDDKQLYTVRDDVKLYTSATLEKIWGKGFVTIGDVTFESAAYVARYIAKKITGDASESHYYKLNFDTGEIQKVKPEYTTMSRRPGIAANWYERYASDLHKDFITVNGIKMKPPKYYDAKLEEDEPELYEILKEQRKYEAWDRFDDNTNARLRVKEKIKCKKFKLLKRDLDL